MVNLLTQFIDEGLNIEFSIPAGGMALWVNVGGNAQKIAELAKQQGIYLLAEHAFHLDQNNNQDKYIRLGFAGQSIEQFNIGFSKIIKLVLHLQLAYSAK